MPIAEYCSDRFIREHKGDVRGKVVKLGASGKEPRTSRRLRHLEVVDRDPYNPAVTFLMDPADADLLSPQGFDCAIVVGSEEAPIQKSTLAHAWAAVRSGGVMLVTAPGRPENVPTSGHSKVELRSLLIDEVGIVDADISSIGNRALAAAFANDSPAEELRAADLQRSEAGSTVMVFARAVKAPL